MKRLWNWSTFQVSLFHSVQLLFQLDYRWRQEVPHSNVRNHFGRELVNCPPRGSAGVHCQYSVTWTQPVTSAARIIRGDLKKKIKKNPSPSLIRRSGFFVFFASHFLQLAVSAPAGSNPTLLKETQAPNWVPDCRFALRFEPNAANDFFSSVDLKKSPAKLPSWCQATFLLSHWNYRVDMAIFNTARPANGWNLAAFPGGVAECGVGSAAGQFRPGRCPLQSARQRNDACTVHVKSFSISPLLSLTHSLTHTWTSGSVQQKKQVYTNCESQSTCCSNTTWMPILHLRPFWWGVGGVGGVRGHLRVRGVRGQEVGHRCFD